MTTSSSIDGVVVTELRQIDDARGAVLHMLRSDAPDFAGFGECYFSEVAPGAVKAWKRHRSQTQNLAVPKGRLRLVIYDNRPSSRSFDALDVRELGRPDAYLRVTIPPGLWYGFAAMGSELALVANCADVPHDPHESETCALDDPSIPYSWNVTAGIDHE